MTVVHLFTCDYCNPERSTELVNVEEGVGEWKAWARVMGDGVPTGWWDVPGVARDGGRGHACPSCILNDRQVQADVGRRRQEETARLTGVDPSTVRDAEHLGA